MVTLQVAQGSPAPPNTNQIPGASGVTVQQAQVTNPSNNPATITTLVLTDTSTGNPSSDITLVTVYENGTAVGTGTFSGTTSTVTLTNPVVVNGGGTVTFEETVTISTTASGTDQFSLTGLTGTINGQPTTSQGLPVQGAQVTVLAPTATAVVSNTAVVVAPNPADGTQPVSVIVPMTMSASDVKVQVFTTAFRKVQEKTYPSLPADRKVEVRLVDDWNKPLASGIYYVVIHTSKGRSVGKLLLLR